MSFQLLKEKINSLIAESTLLTLGRWLPVEYEGLENEGTQHVLPKGAKFIHRHPIKIRIGKEVDFGTCESSALPLKSRYQLMAERVMWEIGELRARQKEC